MLQIGWLTELVDDSALVLEPLDGPDLEALVGRPLELSVLTFLRGSGGFACCRFLFLEHEPFRSFGLAGTETCFFFPGGRPGLRLLAVPCTSACLSTAGLSGVQVLILQGFSLLTVVPPSHDE